MSNVKTEKWKPVQFFLPPSLNQQLDSFVESAVKEAMSDLVDDVDHGYVPKHGWKSKIVVKALREFLASRKAGK